MINERKETQNQLEIVMLENLVPKDHILRELDKYIDFSFIRDITKDLYCLDNGRPGVDPVMLFKMLFIGYLFGIRSERQLIKDIEVNVAYRWFLGLSLTEKVPNASTISQNRRRRFKDTDISQQIFDNIVMQAMDHNMVKGKVLYSDSTHIKANANKRKLEKKEVEVSVKDYLADLDKSVEEDRVEHGKKPLKKNY
jgi:transposase